MRLRSQIFPRRPLLIPLQKSLFSTGQPADDMKYLQFQDPIQQPEPQDDQSSEEYDTFKKHRINELMEQPEVSC